MSSERPNILLIMSDEHDPAVTGCYGHPQIETPHLDQLASEGTTFENAYTACPICVPARMSFMTGQYVHQIGTWDNGSPLPGTTPTIGSYLETAGYETVACGRTHFVGPERLHGFGKRLMDDTEKWKHWSMSAPSRAADSRRGTNSHVTECGPGESSQNNYDRMAIDLSERFLKSRAQYETDRPFLLYTGVMNPHFPLICPQEYFDRYYPDRITLPKTRTEPCESQHPSIQQLRYWLRNEEPLDDAISTTATAAYYGLVSFTDHLIGRLLNVVNNSPLRDNTIVIYVSDHGEMAGNHGIWQKQCFYENAVRVPMIIRHPNAPTNQRVNSGTNLVDILPTLLDIANQEPAVLPGTSLLPAVTGDTFPDRPIFSEYHALGSTTGGFMIKKGEWKYIHYVGLPDQLFNVADDPNETQNRAEDPACANRLSDLRTELRNIVTPEEIDQRAKENQKIKGIARAGREG
ncbi:MAG: sulfatase-like hydrolase/transferase [Candidatus Latescibacteria bacterium]|nr:sulfatase-like hydrolase/transferase [Candidatus Latescibacterota bacterium]